MPTLCLSPTSEAKHPQAHAAALATSTNPHNLRLGTGPALLPPGLALLVDGGGAAQGPQGGVQLQLQQALVTQYSTDEHAVKLREVGARSSARGWPDSHTALNH